MDTELTEYLQQMEGRLTEKHNHLFKLTTDMKESLESEMNVGFEEMASRFDAQALRLNRQAALIQTGSRWIARMNDWAEKVDVVLDKRTQEIAELRTRIQKLEGGAKPEDAHGN
jgi:hypothetical protein